MAEMMPVCIHTGEALDLAGCAPDDVVGKKGTFAAADGTLYEVWRGDRDRAWAVRLPRVMTPTGLLAQAVQLHRKYPLVAGIYMMYCKVSGKAYIGSSGTVYQRLAAHVTELNMCRHSSAHLQHAWRIHGRDKFTFLLIDRMAQDATEETLVDRESYYMLGCGKPLLYNSTVPALIGGAKGRKQSEKTRQQMSASHKARRAAGHKFNWEGKPLSDKRKVEISAFMTGHTFNTPEVREKIGAAHRGHKRCVGAGNPKTDLSEEDVYKIRALVEEERLSQAKIGEMFGITQTAVSSIWLRKSWAHLPDR